MSQSQREIELSRTALRAAAADAVRKRRSDRCLPQNTAGMSYEQASRAGSRLVADAHEGRCGWHDIVDALVELRSIMDRRGAGARQ